jgi:hypothetical protein
MMPQPDKLFRDRLEHFKKTPPPQAWDKVNSGLHTRSAKNLWISISRRVGHTARVHPFLLVIP